MSEFKSKNDIKEKETERIGDSVSCYIIDRSNDF